MKRPAITETEILKARYDEARQIRDAWHHRLETAKTKHRNATDLGLDNDITRRTIVATELSYDDATHQLRVAEQAWINATRFLTRKKEVA